MFQDEELEKRLENGRQAGSFLKVRTYFDVLQVDGLDSFLFYAFFYKFAFSEL